MQASRGSRQRKGDIHRSFRRIPLAAAVALAFAAPAWAQEAAPPQKDREARTLDTVTVTAQKREENLQKVPISLQVLGNQQLEQQNVADFERLRQDDPQPVLRHRRRRRVLRPGLRAGVHARRRQRRRRQPLRFAAQRGHVPRRAADHHHPGRARHPHVRHRPRRGAGRSAGHAVRRQLAVGHGAHHHQQARPVRVLGRLPRWRPTRSTAAASATCWKASSTCRSRRTPRRCAWWAGRSTTPATSTTCAARRTYPTSGHRRRQQRSLRREQLQHRRHRRRARGAALRPQRPLDHHPARHRAEAEGLRQRRHRSAGGQR